MSTREKLKCARTTREVLFILNMLEYLPFFEKANILQVSALRLLKEADLKYIGIDTSGRQKLLKAVPYLSKNIPMTVGENIRHNAVNVEAKYSEINEEKFRLQKTQDELLRCRMELNLKRNELARIQKENKLIFEIIGITAYAKRLVQKLLKNCSKSGNECSSIQRLTIDLESLLNKILIPNDNSNPTKGNLPSPLTVTNNNSRYWNIQQHLSQPPPKPLKNYNTRLYRSNEIYSLPWYSKILKPITIQRYKQTGRNPYCFQQPPVSPLPVLQPPAIVFSHPANEDKKYHGTTISLLTPVTSEYEHPSFVNGLFSKFARNKTSTPYKHSAAKRYSNNNSNTRHQSFVHQSRKKQRLKAYL